MKDISAQVNQLIEENSLELCLECGKCSAVCPMPSVYERYCYESFPRGIIESLLLNPQDISKDTFWYCLACQECTKYCPVGVSFQNFMNEFRELILDNGYRDNAFFCPECGAYIMPKREFDYIQKTLGEDKANEYLMSCHKCKKKNYVEKIHKVDPNFKRWET
ncbi:MAG: 4Fe-4S dicluster domain-containing protein [Thermodesulfobacteriota bacterium]